MANAIDIITKSKSFKDIRKQMNRLVEDGSMNMIESNTIKAYVVYLEIGNEVYYVCWDDYAHSKTLNILHATFYETEEMAQRYLWNIADDLDLRDDDGNVLENMLKIKEVTMIY